MLLYLVFLCIIAALVQEYTLRHALDKVTYDTFPSKTSVDPDEVFEVVTRIGNPKRLPVSYLKFQEALPLELDEGATLAEHYFVEAMHNVPAAALSCCGGVGFGVLGLSGMGQSVSEARRRAPMRETLHEFDRDHVGSGRR